MIADRRTAGHYAETHLCPNCGQSAALVVRWSASAGQYEVYCPRCKATDGFASPKSLTAMWRENPESVPVTVANRLQTKYGGMEPMSDTALAIYSEKQMLQRIQGARWLGEMTAQERTDLSQLAVAYQLDPIMGELIIYEHRPYIPLAGYIRIAHRQQECEGVEDRPMTAEEKLAYGLKAPVCWIAKIYRKGWRVPVTGIGEANPNDPRRKNPIERTDPHFLARSRSLRQAFKLAFPHALPNLPSAEERGEVAEAATNVIEVQARVVDPETGEVTREPANSNGHQEAIASEAQPEQQPEETAAPAPAVPVAEQAPANPTPDRPSPERPSQGLLTRWHAYWQQARQMGVDASDLEFDPNGGIGAPEVVNRLNELLQRIADAKRPKAAAAVSGTNSETVRI